MGTGAASRWLRRGRSLLVRIRFDYSYVDGSVCLDNIALREEDRGYINGIGLFLHIYHDNRRGSAGGRSAEGGLEDLERSEMEGAGIISVSAGDTLRFFCGLFGGDNFDGGLLLLLRTAGALGREAYQ